MTQSVPPASWLRRLAALAPALAPIALGVLVIGAPARLADRVRDLVFDQYQVWSPRPWSPDLPVRIIAIDDDALASLGQWPWPRDAMAELTRKLAALKPSAIGFDIVFSEPDRMAAPELLRRLPAGAERDRVERELGARGVADAEAFAHAIAEAPVVLSEAFRDDASARAPAEPKAPFATLGDDPRAVAPSFRRAVEPLPDLARAAHGVGGLNFIPDRDLIVRRTPLLYSVGEATAARLIPSFDLELLRVAQIDPADHTHASPTPIVKSTGASGEPRSGGRPAIVSLRIGAFETPTESNGQIRIRYAGHEPGRFISARKLLAGSVPPGDIEGRIVLVGVTATSIGDIRSTPIDGAVPGVEIHAEAIEHIIAGAQLERPDYARGAEAVAAIFGGLIAAWIAHRFRPAFSGFAFLGLLAAAGLASWRLFIQKSLLIDPLLPAATWLATWASVTVAIYRRTENERRFVRAAFSRYLAPAVVERLAADPASLRLGGESREITVLFCDARDFTSRSEHMSPEGVVRFLNGLLTPLTEQVLSRGGAIDKYMGDGLMAYWNAPLDTPDHATRACAAALAMIECLPAINAAEEADARASDRPSAPVVIGIGVNTGQAFVGNMGSEQRFDYSMVGDCVNVAARLEAATKEYGVPIIVAAATQRAASGFRFAPLGAAALRGREEEAQIFALHSCTSDSEPDFDAFLAAHQRALAATSADALARSRAELAQFAQSARYARLYDRIADSLSHAAPDVAHADAQR